VRAKVRVRSKFSINFWSRARTNIWDSYITGSFVSRTSFSSRTKFRYRVRF
jgi:hypothetical protein